MRFTLPLIALVLAAPAQLQAQSMKYPETRRVPQVDEQFGVKVADPYRWLENDVRTDAEVAKWVADENAVTSAYLATLPAYVGESAVTLTYTLNSVATTVTIPVVIGLGYTTQGQRLRPATAADIKSQIGDALGKNRRTEIAALLLSNTVGLNVGTSFNALEAQVLPGADGETPLPATSMFTGVARLNLTDNYSYDSMFCWQVSRPWPCTVCATSSFLHASEP